MREKDGTRNSCMEYVSTPTPREKLEKQCRPRGGEKVTFSASPCPTEGSSGYCETAAEGLVFRNHYYGTGAKGFARGCEVGGGVFKPAP